VIGKFSFLYIIIVIVICVSVNIAYSGKVNAADQSATISVKWDNDSNDRPPKWAKKKHKDKKGKKDKGSDDSSASPHH
jgi:hypothetical protein